METQVPQTFVVAAAAAKATGLKQNELMRAARDGTIPSLRVGKRRLFHVPSVEVALLELQQEASPRRTKTKGGKR